jgi:hypothetical protein
MWSYSVWRSNKGWKVENCYGWGYCINWEEWHGNWFLDQVEKTNKCQVNLQRKKECQRRGETLLEN